MQTIKIPNSTSDMTLDNLAFYIALTELETENIEDIDIVTKTDLNALFFGTDTSEFDKFTGDSNDEIFCEILRSANNHKEKPIRPVINVDGINYVFQTDYSKQPVSFHRDLKNADIRHEPEQLIGFAYIEEGFHYNTLDDHKNIVNEREARVEKLKEKFTLAQYVDLHTFFLESYDVLSLSLKIQKAVRETPTSGTGKSPSTT